MFKKRPIDRGRVCHLIRCVEEACQKVVELVLGYDASVPPIVKGLTDSITFLSIFIRVVLPWELRILCASRTIVPVNEALDAVHRVEVVKNRRDRSVEEIDLFTLNGIKKRGECWSLFDNDQCPVNTDGLVLDIIGDNAISKSLEVFTNCARSGEYIENSPVFSAVYRGLDSLLKEAKE